MPWWLKRLLQFLKGFIPEFIKSYFSERKRLQAIADKGASDQRQADGKSDDALAAEAAARREEIQHLPDAEFDHRLGRWVRKPD